MGTWRDSCPLGATCTECGLVFEVRHVLNPALLRRSRFFECAEQRRARSFVRTAFLTLRPWGFWKRVRLEYPFRPGRAALVVAAVVSISSVLTIVAHAAVWRIVDQRYAFMRPFGLDPLGRWLRLRVSSFLATVWPFGSDAYIAFSYRWVSPLAAAVLLAGVLLPVSFGVLPDTLRRARVRRAHLARVSLYSIAGAMVCAQLALPLEAGLNSLLDAYGPMGIYDARTGAPLLGIEIEGVRASQIAPCLVFLWVLLWWHAATGRYLRLPHAAAVTVVMVGLSMLAAVVLLVVARGGWFLNGF
jgi:hypothetical protein